MKLVSIRALRLAFLASVLALTTPAAFAAPTCQDRHGLTIRCGTQGAMPLGWSLPFEERPFHPPGPSASQLLALIGTLGLLFALIALLPEFDGTHDRDWDKQEDDG